MPLIASIPRRDNSIFSKTQLPRRRRCANQLTKNRQEVVVFSWMKTPSLIKYSFMDHISMLLITRWVTIRLIDYLIMKPTVTLILSIMRNPPFLSTLRVIRPLYTMNIISKTMNVPKIDNSFSSNLFLKLQKCPQTNSKTKDLRNMLLWVRSWDWMIPMLSYQEASRWLRFMTQCPCSQKGIRVHIRPSLTLMLLQGAPPLRNNLSITRVL